MKLPIVKEQETTQVYSNRPTNQDDATSHSKLGTSKVVHFPLCSFQHFCFQLLCLTSRSQRDALRSTESILNMFMSDVTMLYLRKNVLIYCIKIIIYSRIQANHVIHSISLASRIQATINMEEGMQKYSTLLRRIYSQ